MTRIVVPYRPRDVFKPYHETDKRYCLTVAHRRCGKTVARINKLIRKAVECELPNPRFAYLSPFYVQSKDIAWLYLKHYSAPLTQLGGRTNEAELSVTLPHNNAVIKLYGAENAERMRGIYLDGITVDEGQGIVKSVLTQIIMPALADRKGWLDVSGTPRGWQNLLGELYLMARNDPEWFTQVLRASETGIIDAEELANQRKLMPANEYEQEFECNFDAAITGSIYGKEMAEADKSGRICPVPYNPSFPVITAWDLGYGDSTAVWFAQLVGKEPRLIDYYENRGEDLNHYVSLVKSKPYQYSMHVFPHDAGHSSLRTGTTLIKQLEDTGLGKQDKDMTVLPVDAVETGINLVRLLLPQIWIDQTKCSNAIFMLKEYRYEYDEKKGIFRDSPRHDHTSHCCDALRYLSTYLARQKTSVAKKSKSYYGNMMNEGIGWMGQ